MAGPTATAMEIFAQQRLVEMTKYPMPEGGIIRTIQPQDDDMVERELLRQKSEYYQNLTRAMPSTSRYNKRLLLCQP